MKKILLYAVLLFTAIGCQKTIIEVEDTPLIDNLVSITIQAQLPQQSSDTRLSTTPGDWDEAWETVWDEDDVLTLVTSSDPLAPKSVSKASIPDDFFTYPELTIESISEDGIATFTGNVPEGTYEVYCVENYTFDYEGNFAVDYSQQVASSILTGKPLKATTEITVSAEDIPADADNAEVTFSDLIFSHISQTMELRVSFDNIAAQYTLTDIVIYGSDYGFDDMSLSFTNQNISATASSFNTYCYLPPFTIGVDESIILKARVLDNGEAKVITDTLTNTTEEDLSFEVSNHNYLTATFNCNNITSDEWVYYAAETFGGVEYSRSGSSYTISSPQELALLSKLLMEGNDMVDQTFTLSEDIDLSGKEWTPIGTFTDYRAFCGTFDGGNFTISGIDINTNIDNSIGLFSYTYSATLKNITVKGDVINNKDYEDASTGGLVGYANYSTIDNCHNLCNVTSASSDAGGVVGYMNGGTMINSSNSGTIKGKSAGGLVGSVMECFVVNSYNSGAVDGFEYAGGVIGSSYKGNLTNCYNSALVSGNSAIGGVLGSSHSPDFWSNVTNCYFNGDGSDYEAINSGFYGTATNVVEMTAVQMKDSDFVTTLNTNAFYYNLDATTSKACAWIESTNDYPKLDISNLSPEKRFFSGGSGTSEDPYQISSADDLRELSDRVNGTYISYDANNFKGSYFEMTQDIDLGGISEDGQTITAENEFTAIGIDESYNINTIGNGKVFRGTFDGGEFEVSGLYINKEESNYQGLFGYIYGATIKNLTVSGSVTGAQYVGGIIGHSFVAYASTPIYVTNCHNKAKVSGIVTSEVSVGGVIGYTCSYASAAYSKVENCSNSGEITSTGSYVGGITGNSKNSTITNCSNSGKISSTKNYLGGIVGNSDDSYVTNCYNTADISSTGGNYVGGIVGSNYGTVTNCYNTADISATGDYAGGITGAGSGSITNCYNTGGVTASNTSVGGITGDTASTVTSCYWASDVTDAPSTGTSLLSIEDPTTPMQLIEMQAASFVTLLTNGAYTYNQTTPTINACGWLKSSAYPTLDVTNLNPEYKQINDVTGGTGL